MDSGSEDFTALRALLKLKRYEEPPPRYYDDLSRGVIHRLRGPEGLRRQSLLAAFGFREGWKPALYYGLGLACCSVSLLGLANVVFNTPGPTADERQPIAVANPLPDFYAAPVLPVLSPNGRTDDTAGSTNPVLSPGTVGFPIDPVRLRTIPVSYPSK